MRMPKRKYKDGEIVIAGYQKLRMVIIGAVLCIKGYRYQLAFPKKDGTPHKGMNHRFFFEEDLNKTL